MRHAATPCSVPRTTQEGGHTIFSLSAIKVVPRKRRMLFFGYKLNGSRMDDGHTEHSGCPLREGRKWIATMWYREGMTAEKGWEKYRH